MRKYLPTIKQLAIFGFAATLLLVGWVKPGWTFHKERKTVEKIAAMQKEILHHLEEGKLDWHHLEEELTDIAKPVRELGHHDKVDLFKPLEDSVHSQDKGALEKAFEKILSYLISENLHRSEDSAGNLEKTLVGFIENARMAYGSLAHKPQAADKQVDRIFKEMKMIARQAQALKAKLAEKKKELDAQIGGTHGH